MDKEIVELRAHHLLCTVLFEGKGYDKSFTENMAEVVDRICSEDTPIKLKTSLDDLCAECPNLMDDGRCRLSDEIATLDRTVIEYFGLTEGVPVYSREVFKKIKDRITPGFFRACCGECRWKKMGICRYRKYIKNIDRFC